MANPSLQIGNSNWAIKEDNLLGYSTAGTRFVPQPITMTRASAGTRVNSSGLVETVELLGSEKVTCGNFQCAVPTDSWIEGTGWDIASGKASCDGTNISYLTQTGILNTGTSYKVQFDIIDYTSGSVKYRDNGLVSGQSFSGIGSYTDYVVAGGGQFRLMSENFIGSISNVSVKESTKNNLARVDYDGTASSLLAEPERRNLITYSSDFSQWTHIGTPIISSDYGISPDGTQNADRVQMETGDRLTFNSSSANVSFSVYAKSNDGLSHTVSMRDGNSNVTYNMVTTNEWQRFDVYLNTTMTNVQFRSFEDDVDILIWGAQTEVGSYPTSLIPTSGGTVTRVRDQYSKTGISNLIGQTKGTMFIDLNFINISNVQVLFCLHDGAANKRLEIWASSAVVNGFIGGSVNIAIGAATITNGRHKIALAYDQSGNQAFYVDGVQIGTSGTAYTISALTTFSFNYFNNNSYFLSGSVNHTEIYKERLTNEELIALTTI